MGTGVVADSNVIIDFVVGRLPQASADWLDAQIAAQQVLISVVTRIELLSKAAPAAEYLFMQSFVKAVTMLPLSEPVIQQTIHLRQQHRIKLPDAIIAATALVHGLPLLTRNVADFSAMPGLAVLNPHHAAQLPPL